MKATSKVSRCPVCGAAGRTNRPDLDAMDAMCLSCESHYAERCSDSSGTYLVEFDHAIPLADGLEDFTVKATVNAETHDVDLIEVVRTATGLPAMVPRGRRELFERRAVDVFLETGGQW